MSKRSCRAPAQLRSSQIPDERLLLIDTDAGTDDAWALFMALAFHKAQALTGTRILGFTTVCGNTTVEHVSNNVTRTLNTVNETTLPIYQGLGEFLTNPFTYLFDPPYHGEDGFGDANLPPVSSRLESEHGVQAIIRLAEQFKGKLVLVAIGPLTNLALAVKLKPEIRGWIKEIWVLGGNMDALGNTTAAAEFNFYADPEAAGICVDSYPPCQFYVVPWETAIKATSTLEFRKEVLGKLPTPQVQLLNTIEAENLGRIKEWMPPDAVTMACALDPSIVRSSQQAFAKVEIQGTHTRGMLVVDKDNVLGNEPNLTLITDLNVAAYESFLVWAAGGQAPSHINNATAKRTRTT